MEGLSQIYFSFVFITFIYVIHKYRYDIVSLLIILCFYGGLANYLGKTIENPYKILLVLMSIYIAVKYKAFRNKDIKARFVILSFVLFSTSFFLSALINKTYFALTFSQYGKYVTPLCLFFVFWIYYLYLPQKIEKLERLVILLLIIQVVLTISKLFIIGINEFYVGSISYIGGGAATTLPVFGFMFLWLYKKGAFTKKDWVFIFLMLSIGFASNKRAIWFIAPIIIFLFMLYIPRKITFKRVLLVLPILPFIFYLGVISNSTLNKENQIGGSFDIDYVFSYAKEYTFGEDIDRKLGEGRGGATFLLYHNFFKYDFFSKQEIFGYGLDEVYTKSYEEFDIHKFGVRNLGSVGGVYQSYISVGYLGIFTTLLYIFSLIFCIKEKRIRIVLTGLLLWDYFFYSGLILREQSLSILFFYIIIYSNLQWKKGVYLRYYKRMYNHRLST